MAMSGRLGLTVGEASRQWIFVYILSGIIVAAAFGFYLRDLGRKNKLPVVEAAFRRERLPAASSDLTRLPTPKGLETRSTKSAVGCRMAP
jgi:hypothetical protein